MFGLSVTTVAILAAVIVAAASNRRAVGQALARLGGASTTLVLVAPVAVCTRKGSTLRGSAGNAVSRIFREIGELTQELVIGLARFLSLASKATYRGSKWIALNTRRKERCNK